MHSSYRVDRAEEIATKPARAADCSKIRRRFRCLAKLSFFHVSHLQNSEWMSCKAGFFLFLARMRYIVILRAEILDENRGNLG